MGGNDGDDDDDDEYKSCGIRLLSLACSPGLSLASYLDARLTYKVAATSPRWLVA